MKQANAPAEVHRLGRRPDPWAWPDWAYAEADATFGNRYDDPQGIYRVLYASTQRVATFVECLAYYRADIELVAALQAIVGEEGDEEPPATGVVPASWVEQRCVGRATLDRDYADVGHHQSLAELRTALGSATRRTRWPSVSAHRRPAQEDVHPVGDGVGVAIECGGHGGEPFAASAPTSLSREISGGRTKSLAATEGTRWTVVYS